MRLTGDVLSIATCILKYGACDDIAFEIASQISPQKAAVMLLDTLVNVDGMSVHDTNALFSIRWKA